jgi:hypothetical protein
VDDEVQGDQEGGLHGEGGDAGRDGDSRRFMGRLSLTRGAGSERASQVLRRRFVILRLAAEG